MLSSAGLGAGDRWRWSAGCRRGLAAVTQLGFLWSLLQCQSNPHVQGQPRLPPQAPPASATPAVSEPMPLPQASSIPGIGRPAPTTFGQAAKDGSWLTFCQADRDVDGDGKVSLSVGPRGELMGDALSLYLWLAGKQPQPIQAFWGADPSERWLVVSQAEGLSIVDSSRGEFRRIDASSFDLKELGGIEPGHRALAFAQGQLLYSREQRGGFDLGAVPLAEQPANLAFLRLSGRLSSLRTSHDGNWWIIESVEQDTNHNGRLDLPLPFVQDKARCHARFQSFPVWASSGDTLTTRVRSTQSGKVYRVDDFAGPLGAGFLFRDAARALWLRRGEERIALAPADCGAQIVHADAQRGLAVVACRGPLPPKQPHKRQRPTPPRTRLPLWLMGEGISLDLELELGPTGADRWASDSPRLVAIHAGRERRLLDMDARKLVALGPRDTTLATFESRALVMRPGALELLDAVEGTQLVELKERDPLGQVLVQGRFAFVSPYLVDMKLGVVVGTHTGEVLALSTDGRLLTSAGSDSTGSALGPLQWRTATATHP